MVADIDHDVGARVGASRASPRLGVRVTLLKHRWRRRFTHFAVAQSDEITSEGEQPEDLSLESLGQFVAFMEARHFCVSRQGRISLEAVLTSRALMAD